VLRKFPAANLAWLRPAAAAACGQLYLQ